MNNPIGLTCGWVAASRARETNAHNRLFDDPFAQALAGEAGFALLSACQKARGSPADGPDPYLSIRTRFFDDALLNAVHEGEIRQVVLMAAGMDSRAFRLDWPDGVTLFEIDQEEVLRHKEITLRRLEARPRCHRRIVPADLERDWICPLTRAGFDKDSPAAFLVEGLLMYLEPAAVDSLLSALERHARPRSWLGVDLVGTELLCSPYFKTFLDHLKRLGCPWRFGAAEPEQLFAQHGWAATVVLPGEPAANYGRWPYPVAPRRVPGIPRSYLVTARRLE
jgi:methyltransferase (TIGR00027 family)